MENKTQNVLNFGVRHQLDDVIGDKTGQSAQKQEGVTEKPTIPPLHYSALFQPMTCLAIGSNPAVDTEWKSDGCEVNINFILCYT